MMPGSSLPQIGDDVNVLAARGPRLRGQVTGGGPDRLTVELEQTPLRLPFRFPPGSAVAIEWVHPRGFLQLSARVEASRLEPLPTLEVAVDGAPEPAERRAHERARLVLETSAWSPLQPTQRFSGTTVDLSANGALLRLPGLSPFAATIDVRIGLPGRPFTARAKVVRRAAPDLVGIAFEALSPDEQARLIEFVRESTRHHERLTA